MGLVMAAAHLTTRPRTPTGGPHYTGRRRGRQSDRQTENGERHTYIQTDRRRDGESGQTQREIKSEQEQTDRQREKLDK